ncbi:DUF4240 domain-containing protein [Allokutzneria sp. A3M-2-11 16]|uniref:DUF4240 domain-containing protein n=1 Tax=Allokutzneria sp. A3M-2-11 16 TaxID=2962043 RepID=UPI0020B76BEA|nr:DUF4240 domain-containing protein [Allokutzneria sp. A3M-2-11 16]MCP3804234.1 DUF4240 domain-containing protein [Allokutzneria sp. A3M-2-11 16]
MDENNLWRLVEEAAAGAADVEEQAERLTELLTGLAPIEVVEFERLFEVQLARADRWDLWAAAYVALGGCSDDGFDYFRSWLISLGRKAFEVALADPDAMAGLGYDDEDFGDGEALMCAAGRAYRRLTGEELPEVALPPGDTTGEPFDGDDWDGLVLRFPRIAARFDVT